MGPEDVSASWLSGVLGAQVGAIEVSRIGDGLVGHNLRVGLIDAEPGLPGSVVLKLPSLDPTSRQTGLTLRTYEREVKFYTELASTVDLRIPHCHHGELDATTGDFVLVLEDMAPAAQGDQLTGCSVEQAFVAVDELARLHGPRWDDPALDEVDWLNRQTGPEDRQQMAVLWQLLFPGFEATYARYLSEEALDLARRFGGVVADWSDRGRPWTVVHGDFRVDNLLFETEEGGPPLTTVDWQTPAQGPPLGDLAYFCGASLLPDERRRHERELLDAYLGALEPYGVSVDRDWAWTQYRRDAFAGVIMAVLASQVVGESERSEAMFAAMATRHLQHALDLDSFELI